MTKKPRSGPRPDLSVVIPAFNEEQRLPPTLEEILGFLENRPRAYEVIVVDDASTDETLAVVSGFSTRRVRAISLERNSGKGAAVRTGVLSSRGRWVLISDADLSTPIAELERLEQEAQADLVFGSRGISDSRVTRRQAFARETMGKTFNFIIRSMGLTDLHDTQCGFKLLRGEVARDLFSHMKVDGFAFDVELAWLARRLGYTIVEVGVEWRNSPESKVDPLTDSLEMLWTVIRLRLRSGLRPGAGRIL